ncbi:hypothetical protein TIFTF001_021521 [Ficus carica]|uniref:Protein FAR1-RELATED SEQUENCE n=1 Tax=Ficus carica TaxID=3494 RepID=A0AA88AHM0_FICCA|nr:hypothetical protein TIFTF001_021521 [Ficus carica]
MEFEALNSGMANDVNESHMMDMGDVEHRDDLHYNHDPSSGAESVLEPYEGMEFESEEVAKAFYNSYARRVGFSTRVSMSRRSRRDGAIIQRSFVCAKEGFRIDKPRPERVKRPRAETRVGFKAMLAVKIQESGRWVVSSYFKQHNHDLVPPDKAAWVYTRKLFVKFQEELVETLTFLATKVEEEEATTTHQVSKFGESQKAYYVRFNVREMKASSSCQMFEFSGLLCRHILTVFRVTTVLTLPSRYVLKHWTRNAKSGIVLEDRAGDLLTTPRESLTVRYDNLRHEALKYVDRGVNTVETYNEAMDALREAANKVALVKNGGKLGIANGPGKEDCLYQGSRATNVTSHHQKQGPEPLSMDEQDKKIDKLTRQLERARQKQEAYRANLLAVLKDIEQQKLHLSVKVQNIKVGMKE